VKVAHLTTVDLSLRYLVLPQLQAVVEEGGEALGISAPGPFVPDLEAVGVRHVPLTSSTRGMDLGADLRAAVELWRILRRERPDVLHTHNPKPGIYGRIVGRLAGVPLVVNTVHGLYAAPDDPLPRRLVVYGLEGIASRFSHVELVQNPEDLALLTRWRISAPGKTRLLGNGVDLARFDPSRFPPEERLRVRRELGIGDSQVVVGAVGRLVAEKGYPELFEAFEKIDDRFVLVVVGPDDPEKADALPVGMVAAARAAGVRLLGMRDDVDRLYAAMDLFVLPSHREGFPRAAMEAAATGLPVIATDIRGCREVVADGENGRLVPVRDVEALRQAIVSVGGDAAGRSAMGDASRRRALERFDERRVVRTVMDAYEPVRSRLAGRRRFTARAMKRALDVTVAAIALVVLSPLLAIVALAVRVGLGRPVLFTQTRPGRDGVPFRVRKFRTMRDAVGPDGLPLADEERLTRLGSFLRSSSLDELPELINVLRGEMSLVGPRPLLMEYLDLYSPRQARRHEVRPGLTGWAQVNGRNDTTWEQRLELDVWYVDHWSLHLDLEILLRTARAVLRREGISQDGHVTMPKFEGGGR
jgi:lipopolysaccharide/colanic/teichoic acid biosynthesis glycosyltransferase